MKNTQLVTISHVVEDAANTLSVYNKTKALRKDLSEAIDLAKDAVLGFIESNHPSQLERVEGMFEEGIEKVQEERAKMLKGKPDDIITFVTMTGTYTWTTRSETKDDIILEMKISPNYEFDFNFHVTAMIRTALNDEISTWQTADINIAPGVAGEIDFKDFFDITNVQFVDESTRVIVQVDEGTGEVLRVGADKEDVTFEVIRSISAVEEMELNESLETSLVTKYEEQLYKRFGHADLEHILMTEEEVRDFYKAPTELRGQAIKKEEE